MATAMTDVALAVRSISVDDDIGTNLILSCRNALIIGEDNWLIFSMSKPFLGFMASTGGVGYVMAVITKRSSVDRDLSDIPENACCTSDSMLSLFLMDSGLVLWS